MYSTIFRSRNGTSKSALFHRRCRVVLSRSLPRHSILVLKSYDTLCKPTSLAQLVPRRQHIYNGTPLVAYLQQFTYMQTPPNDIIYTVQLHGGCPSWLRDNHHHHTAALYEQPVNIFAYYAVVSAPPMGSYRHARLRRNTPC